MKLNSHHSNWVFSPQKPPPKSHEVNWRPTRDAVTRPGLFRGRSHISGTGKSNHNKRMFIRMVRLCTVIILPKKKHKKKHFQFGGVFFFSLPRVRKWNISGDLQIGLACLGTSDSNTSKGRPKTQSLGGSEPLEVATSQFCETLSRTLGYPTNMHRHLQIQAATSLVAVAHGQPFPRLNSGNGIHGYGPWHGHVLTFLVPFKLTICGPVDLSYLSPDIIWPLGQTQTNTRQAYLGESQKKCECCLLPLYTKPY